MDFTEENHTQKLDGSNGSTESSAYAKFEGRDINIPKDSISSVTSSSSNPYFSWERVRGSSDSSNVSEAENEADKGRTMAIKGVNNETSQMYINPTFLDSGSFTEIITPPSSIYSVPSNSSYSHCSCERVGITSVLNSKDSFYDSKNRDVSRRDSRTWPKVIDSPNIDEQKRDVSRRDSRTWPKVIDSPDLVDETETAVGPPSGMNIEDVSYIADNRLFPKIDSTGGDSHYLDLEKHHKSKKNCPLRIMILIFVIGCISGGVAWVIYNRYVLGSKDTPTVITDDLPDFPDKCENDISIARVGEQICIPYTQKFTSRPSGIHVSQLSSQYMSVLQGFAVNMSSDAFEQQNGGWIINFNSSRTDQQLRFMKGKATCDSVGIYEITVEYDDGNVSSSKFEIKLKDPQLQHSVTRINDSIHIHCEMIKTCVASSLALFVNDGGSSRMIPNINVCSDNHQERGTTVSADAIIPAAWFSRNMTISCIPLMTDPGLAANLTSTTRIPVCEGDCIPDCTNDPQSEAYFPDKNDCTKFYQCSNGKLVFQTCSSTTYWSPSKCTCDHFDDEICNKDTNKFFKPLLSIEKCTKASLV